LEVLYEGAPRLSNRERGAWEIIGGQLNEVASDLGSTFVIGRESNTCDGGEDGSQSWDEEKKSS
jgi:hypothetical protein